MPALDDELGVGRGVESVRLERAARYLGRASGEPRVPQARVGPPGDAERASVARVLDFTPAPARELVTSPTALADFRRCPRQYWYRHVVHVPERGTGGGRAMLCGTAAHGVLEMLRPEAAGDGEIERLLAARPEALALRRADL